MDARERVLEVAEAQLDASPRADVAVRAVCEAAGVGAPALYRIFGDKSGLLEATVNRSFERYLGAKRAAPASADPVHDLRAGWDSHLAFAVTHPSVYQLVYSPAFATVPAATGDALALLQEVLERCARGGLLRVAPDAAAQTVMSANVGVALSEVTQPTTYDDPALSHRVRDAVHAAVLVPAAAQEASAEPRVADDATEGLRRSAVSMGARLREAPDPVLTTEENALLQQWLTRLGTPG